MSEEGTKPLICFCVRSDSEDNSRKNEGRSLPGPPLKGKPVVHANTVPCVPPKTNQSGNIKNMQTTCLAALFVRKVGWTDGSVHRLGLGRRTSEHDVHVGRLLDKVVVWHSDDDCAQLCRSRTLCTELFQWSVLHLICTQSLHPTNHTDASAALSIAFRSGAGGRTRHDAVILGARNCRQKGILSVKGRNLRESS